MAENYAGDDTNFPDEIVIPEDGDLKPAASINPAVEGLADRTAYLGRITRSHFGSVVRPVVCFPRFTSGEWTIDTGVRLTQVQIATSPVVAQLLHLPHGCTLQTVTAYYKGGAGHAFGLPAGMPSLSIYRQRVNNGAADVQLALTADASADVAAFEVLHSIACTVNAVIDNSLYIYFLILLGEFDIDTAMAGAKYYGAVCTSTIADLDVGAA